MLEANSPAYTPENESDGKYSITRVALNFDPKLRDARLVSKH